MVRSNRHLHIEGYDEFEDKIQVYKRIGPHKFTEEKVNDEIRKYMLDEIIWAETKTNLKEKQVKKYEEKEGLVHIYYTDGAENKVRNLNETKKDELVQELDTILLNQLKEKVVDYEIKKEVQNGKIKLKDVLIGGMLISLFALELLIHFESSVDVINDFVKEEKKEKNDIRLTKLYLANMDKLEHPVQIVKNKECITTKVTPNNLDEFSYKSLKKAIKNR